MLFKNDFTLAAPADRVWPALLDIPALAACLPGAELDSQAAAGIFRGTLALDAASATATYAGTVRLSEVDEDLPALSMVLGGRSTDRRRMARATITARLEPRGELTRVLVETDLRVLGPLTPNRRAGAEAATTGFVRALGERLEHELPRPPGTSGHPAERRSSRRVAAAIGVLLLLAFFARRLGRRRAVRGARG